MQLYKGFLQTHDHHHIISLTCTLSCLTVTLQYGLTAAPAAQPLAAIVGYAVAVAIAIGIGSIRSMALWIRQSLGPALAITAMIKLGLPHPPAGAFAVDFAAGSLKWSSYGTTMVGVCIAVVTSTIINNINPKRLYPTYWGFVYLRKQFKTHVTTLFKRGNPKEDTTTSGA